MHHNRIVAVIAIGNLAALAGGAAMSSMLLANLALAVLARQQYFINLAFWLATRAPVSWPLRIRWTLGKVYHLFGGLHIGATVCATVWFTLFTATLTAQLIAGTASYGVGLVGLTYLILVLLIGMVVLASAPLRQKHHDLFERSHRFGGWTVLALFGLHSYLSAAGPAHVVVLGLVVVSVALPWLRLRRVPVRIDSPSAHVALTRFDYGVTPFAGSSTTVSRNPLLEWHSFANVPSPNQHGFRLTISRAGDWTATLIDDKPSHLWVKGIPTAGVGNIDQLFRRVVWVATGSGIGPCLPHLLAGQVPSRLVWSTRHPRATYGDELVDEILAVQPDALVWDTTSRGKPDLLALAYQAYVDSGAEAVICISNKKTTWHIVEELEIRGIPAYGAIWDS